MSGETTASSSSDAAPLAPNADRHPEFSACCDAIEEAYEFMLAYAAQGVASEQGSAAGSQIREFISRCDRALTGLLESLSQAMGRLDVPSAAPYEAFIRVVESDVQRAQAAVQLVLAQPSISSMLVDNLNASTHLRAVLTDLFLLDEVLKK